MKEKLAGRLKLGVPTSWRGRQRMNQEPEERVKAELNEVEIRVLIQFMSEVGAAMNGAGDATTFIRRSLQRIGGTYGLKNLEVFVVPTLLLLRYGDDRSNFVDLTSQIPPDLRLDQVAALYDLVGEAEEGRVNPAAGMSRLRAILKTPPRFPSVLRILAMTLVAAGIVLILDPSVAELVVTLLLALLVGAVKLLGEQWPPISPLVPAVAGLVTSSAALFLIGQGLDCRPLLLIIPPLTIFLPGAALTVSMIELANGDIVAGGSRLAYGAGRLLILVFGVVVGAQWTDLPEDAGVADAIPLSSYVPLLGLLAFTVGVYVHYSAPSGSFPWLLLVVGAAWVGQQIGSFFLGAYLGGFAGGALMIVVARAIQTRKGAPPLIVSFTPAFWLLVPGAIGLEGLTRVIQTGPLSGADDIVAMFVTMVSIALGILFGLMLSGSGRALEPP